MKVKIVHCSSSPHLFEFFQQPEKFPKWYSVIKNNNEKEVEDYLEDLIKRYHGNRGLFLRYFYYDLPDISKLKKVDRQEIQYLEEEKVLPVGYSQTHTGGRLSIVDRYPEYTDAIVKHYLSKDIHGLLENDCNQIVILDNYYQLKLTDIKVNDDIYNFYACLINEFIYIFVHSAITDNNQDFTKIANQILKHRNIDYKVDIKPYILEIGRRQKNINIEFIKNIYYEKIHVINFLLKKERYML